MGRLTHFPHSGEYTCMGAGGLETALLKHFWGEEMLVPHPVMLRVYPMLQEYSKDHIWNHTKYCSDSS